MEIHTFQHRDSQANVDNATGNVGNVEDTPQLSPTVPTRKLEHPLLQQLIRTPYMPEKARDPIRYP